MAKQKADGQQGGGPGTRGYGGLFHDRYRDRHGVVKEVATWSIRYWANGKQRTESAHTTDRRAAEKLLQIKLGTVKDNKWTPPQANKTTFDELAQLIIDDYKANGRRSLDTLEDSLTHLRLAFAGQRAQTIETDRITAYIARRQSEDLAAKSTINKELAALKRMFRLGLRAKKVLALPYIPMLRTANARKGFFEADQLQTLLRHLPDHLHGVIQSAALTGWRLKSELCTRQWQHVDFHAGWLRLEPGETKNDEGRQFPLIPQLREALEQQWEYTQQCQKDTCAIIPWVFHRDGKPLKHFRRSWLTACRQAGIPDRIPHDFRRTAVRNLERSGVSRSAAMKMVGHKTESIYRRYAIVSEGDLKRAGEQLAKLEGSPQGPRQESRRESGLRSLERERQV